MKETIATWLARIDERLRNLIDSNDKGHKEILNQISELSTHVNHEITNLTNQNKAIEKRVGTLEIYKTSTESKYKGRMELYRWIAIGLGIVVSLMTFLHACGIF